MPSFCRFLYLFLLFNFVKIMTHNLIVRYLPSSKVEAGMGTNNASGSETENIACKLIDVETCHDRWTRANN